MEGDGHQSRVFMKKKSLDNSLKQFSLNSDLLSLPFADIKVAGKASWDVHSYGER